MSNSFYVSIDKAALKHNVDYLKSFKNKEVLPVIKANAYGHDILLISELLYEIGVKVWAVARLDEAINVIKNMKQKNISDFEILVFESVDDYKTLLENQNIIATINELSELKMALANNIDSTRLAIKVDMGFARNGLNYKEIEELKSLMRFNNLKFHTIFSHLFSASYEDGEKVIKDFTEIVNTLGKNNFKMIHLQNAASVYNYNIEIVTHIRTGMLVYGLQEPGYYDIDLKPVFTALVGGVDSVRYCDEIDYVAYDTLDTVSAGTKKIAKIKIGYGDGFPKANNGTTCLIKKKEYKIIQVTMDNTFIEVDDRVNVGDEVYLYHRPNEMKAKIGLGMLELLIALSPLRIKRVLKGENQ